MVALVGWLRGGGVGQLKPSTDLRRTATLLDRFPERERRLAPGVVTLAMTLGISITMSLFRQL